MATGDDLPLLPFKTTAAWETWLEKNHETAPGVWIQFFKKGSEVPTVTYAEAVEVALCYGWIDSLVKGIDEKSYKQKFTPRGPKSIWSKINTAHIERLTKLGKMKPAGMKAVADAKADGRWDQAYDSPKTMTFPEAFHKALEKEPKAKAFFETLSKSNKYSIAWSIQTAKKPETKARRMDSIIEKLKKGERF